MLCPFCLADVAFTLERPKNRPAPLYLCSNPECKQEIPSLYVRDYSSFPPVVMSAVGFRGHGKTVYFAALFHVFKRSPLARYWPNFLTLCPSEEDLETVYRNVEMLQEGTLPDATPKNFPRPTMIRIRGLPMQPDCTLLCYDTGGECFEKPRQLVQYAGFVKRARTAVLLIDLSRLKNPAEEMHRLLEIYVIGLADLGGRTRDQHLAVVYTKADELGVRLHNWPDLRGYLTEGAVDGLASPRHYMARLHAVSDRLQQFTGAELQGHGFLHLARHSFRSVSFSMVSSLGARPAGNKLTAEIVPRRVLDPLLWLQHRSLPKWKQTLQKWRV